jgi:chromosome segregation ATPase
MADFNLKNERRISEIRRDIDELRESIAHAGRQRASHADVEILKNRLNRLEADFARLQALGQQVAADRPRFHGRPEAAEPREREFNALFESSRRLANEMRATVDRLAAAIQELHNRERGGSSPDWNQ